MSKIVIAVNVMITEKDKISGVVDGGGDGELFFLYDGKHKWSMMNGGEGYVLFYYPGRSDINNLASIPPEEWPDDIDMVVYRVRDIGTKEAKESFADLYAVLKAKKWNMDSVLDEIIATGPF
ncbi:hypothetical protein BOP96_19120 [Pseudomonas sp. FSL W5-0203]|jgi:hypothetical protein|uniref:hypothetical protein n=1 Tax=Pseudomonas sp. FSL W5-0203 TaxID=1920491 RepID=UPI00093715A2|nr:hypothetical protein [Pseudomonas sp. FSL W5-0203]OJT28777.1 hypothetical protein BOP96_19120 [Pseudomonas sp. FSL W5-0203]